ncbi:MAG: helix-turn-helix transcriptional regulator [Verrucomicrobiae bacterium]|nr:helix-turn-helix transcriptional regulator [Verrucomicrobiae bacterium]
MEHKFAANAVGAQIRRVRYRQNVTQEMLAARCTVAGCEISRGTLAKIEAQIRGVSDMELFVMARVLGVAVKELFPPDFARILKQQTRKNLKRGG